METCLKEFWEKGYTIIPACVPNENIVAVMKDVKKLKYVSIFNRVYGENNFDDYRFQAQFPKRKKSFQNIQSIIQPNVIDKLPTMRWNTEEWVVLKSLPGGSEQEPHHDFPSFETGRARATYNTIQGGLIIGLMDQTQLIVFESCFTEADMSKKKIIKFNAGDCVLFRGDLVHAGASYEHENYRIHSTITVKGIEWQQNAIEAAPAKIYKCAFCPYLTNMITDIYNHSRWCKKNPRLDEMIAMRKAQNSKGKKCVVCDKHFAKKDAYYQHRKRKHSEMTRD